MNSVPSNETEECDNPGLGGQNGNHMVYLG